MDKVKVEYILYKRHPKQEQEYKKSSPTLDYTELKEAMDEVYDIIADIVDTSNDDRSSQQASRAIDLLRVIRRG